MSATPASPAADRHSFLGRLTGRAGFAPYAALTLLCALLYLPGLATIPPTDRDEARFMQATRQMIETGDYVNIRFQDEPRNKKPAGIHWLQTAAVALAGQGPATPWPYRLPSVLAAWVAVMGTCYLGARLFDRATGAVAGLVLATSFMVVIEAHIAKTDATLLAATVAALGALGVLYTGKDAPRPSLAAALVFWVALAAGALVKGPVSCVVALAAVAALWIADRDARWLARTRPLLGLPLALVLVLPWFLASSGSADGNNFLVEAVRGDLIPKLVGGQESHGAPPGTHLVAGLVTAWPWSLLFPFALVFAWRQRACPAVRFCLAWLGAAWLLFEIVPTKLPHYTLPAFPAFALLAAHGLRADALPALMRTVAGRLYRGLWITATLAVAGGVIYAAATYGAAARAPALGAALALAVGAAAAVLDWRKDRAALTAAAGAVAFAVLLSAGVVPRLSALAVSPRLAAALAPHRADAAGPVFLAGYSEPSAVFLIGTDTVLTTTASVTAHVLAHPGAVGVVESEHVARIARAAADAGAALRTLGEVSGYNYSKGDPVHLSIITAVPVP